MSEKSFKCCFAGGVDDVPFIVGFVSSVSSTTKESILRNTWEFCIGDKANPCPKNKLHGSLDYETLDLRCFFALFFKRTKVLNHNKVWIKQSPPKSIAQILIFLFS